jgi:hypothetical protein
MRPNDPELTGDIPKPSKALAGPEQDTPCRPEPVPKAAGGARCSDWLGGEPSVDTDAP